MGGTKRLFWVWGVLFVFLSFFYGCGAGKGIPADNRVAGKLLEEYIIQPGDSLIIDVIEEGKETRTVLVRPDGKISLPMINDVTAAGLPPSQLRRELLKKYKKFYNVVEVSVTVTSTAGSKISIIGNVNSPGQFQLTHKTTFLEAMCMAGGLNDWADASGIYILRQISGKKVKIAVDYDDVVEGKAENIWVLPGDIIVVP